MKTEERNFALKQDGKYLIRIADEDDTIGIFKGYSSLGGDTAMVIEMDGGKIRFIPISQIVYIDQLEIPSSQEQPSKVDIYYR